MASLVHIVDDDAQVRAATAFLLSSHGYATEVYSDGVEFLRDARLTRGCILLDLRMPGMSGHAVLEELSRRGVDLPVVMLSGHGELQAGIRAMKLGAVDFLSKPASEDELFGAIERALAAYRESEGRRATGQSAAARLQPLSRRERQILQGLVAGLSNKAIARTLDLSPRTVEMHRANMMDELGVTSLSEALRLAIDGGLPPLDGAAEPAPKPARAAAARRSRDDKESDALRLVLEASADGAWEWIIPTNQIRMSARIVERLGYSDDSAIDRLERLREHMHPDDWHGFREELDAHLSGRTDGFTAEFRLRTRDGGWAWLQDSGSVIERDPAGTPLRMVGSLTDITRRKEEQQRAREAGELLELAQWGSGAGSWEIDIESRCLRLSERSRELHGLAADGPETMSADEWTALVHEEDLAELLSSIDAAAATGEPWRMEYRSLGEDGRWRSLIGLGKAVRDADGRPRRFLGLSQAAGSGTGFRLDGEAGEDRQA